MANQIQTLLNYLLDSETTSERSFVETIQKHNELFQSRHLKDWEHTVLCKLQQLLRNTVITSLTNEDSNSETSDDNDDDDDESSEDDESQNPPMTSLDSKPTKMNKYTDVARQCQRLLRILYFCQGNSSNFSELYFRTLEQCLQNDNEKIVVIALQQIATHLFEGTRNDTDYERLIQNLPSLSILPSYQPILKTIQTFQNTNRTDLNTIQFLSTHLDILYPYTTRFLNIRSEFRDTAHYLIDGDSLLLSVIHHVNLNLNSNYGNTLHVIFIIERILFTLIQQSQQANYTLVFFDCHYQVYQDENTFLSLLRTCLIAHLSKNSIHIQQFSSWLDENYQKFIRDEKPMFLFYHNLSNFNFETNPFLSEHTFERLYCLYHLFGNYHQYTVQCQLYLMNKLILNETMVKCFQIQFHRVCPKRLFDEILQTIPQKTIHSNGQDIHSNKYEELCENLADNDIRLFLYLKTIVDLPKNHTLTPLLILHVALLIRLSLADRHLSSNFPQVIYSPKFIQFLTEFQQQLISNIDSTSSSLSWSKIADLFDGRLFAFTLQQIHQSTNIRFDCKTNELVRECLQILNIPSNDNLFQQIIQQLIESKDMIFSSSTNESQTPTNKQKQRIIQISNPLINTYLEPILRSKDTPSYELINPDEKQILSHRQIWDTYKDAGDEISRIQDNDAKQNKSNNPRYRTKNQQKLYEYFNLYGRSLNSRDTRDNQLNIVLPTASTPAPSNKENASNQVESLTTSTSDGKKKQQHKNQPKKVQLTKKEQIIEQNKQRKMDKRSDDESEKLKNLQARLKQVPSNNYLDAIEMLEEGLPNFETKEIRLEILKLKFDIQRKYLRLLKKKSQLSSEEKSTIEFLQIGFFATMCEMTHLENVVDAFSEKKKFMEELCNDSALNQEKWYRFQMEKINSRLPRRAQGQADDRITDFIPDEWQVKFLDAVDKRQSIIIVAPTASGKTYASYYAMHRVLKDKEDTNGICIYVAPTKALINQVAGTINTKFGPIFGIFTKDYRMNLQSCRILVTVPECLEMLLVSPVYQSWCQRIRYCIFDEIHCMSGEIGSDVWERTMLLINCPMIGLSATVNNGQQLEKWIENVEQQRSKLFQNKQTRQVCFISHHERLADLNKYLYSNQQLYPVHPIGLMNAKQLTTRGIPKDFYLSPSETLRLNDSMQKLDVVREEIPSLTEHFSPGWIAERAVCNSYSQIVCNQFQNLIHTKQNSTIDSISSSLNTEQVAYPEIKPMSTLIGEFVLTLKEKNLLPCIIFTDSRALCEELAESVAEYFEQLEKQLRETKYKRQIEQLEQRLTDIDRAQKSAKAKKTVKSSSKRDENGEKLNEKPGEIRQMEEEDQSYMRLSGYEQELLDGVLDEGTLADRKHCDRELVSRLIDRAARKNKNLARYVKRGVAYHHAQLNNQGRLAVEGLFRNRYVQIVFSTWTLALGVHMPTKTVAFLKDSIELDALQYRQSSGRAGRRGFDVQGNIIFIDIPLTKIRHLTISAIPNIQTHLPINLSFLMRLLHFYSNAADENDAINRSLVTLQCPFNAQLSNNQHRIDLQMRYFCLYTFDFLYRLNFIDQQGNLVGLAGLLMHLHDFEPANILFAYLVNAHVFQSIKNDEQQIVNLLAYIFTNMPWSITHQSLVKRNSMFNSKVSLRPISSDIRQHIDRYNSLVKQIYGSYIETLIERLRSLNSNDEFILPLTNISFDQSIDYDQGSYEYHLHHHHSQQSSNPSISPFAGLSGLTHEQFMTNFNSSTNSWDLAYNLDGLSHLIPFVDIDNHDQNNNTYYLNSYAVDFYNHGSERLLLTENGLDQSDTFNSLQRFLFALTSIEKSFSNILENEIKQQTNTKSFFQSLSKLFSPIQIEYSKKFFNHFK